MTEPEHVWEQPPRSSLAEVDALEARLTNVYLDPYWVATWTTQPKQPPDTSWVTTEWVGRDVPGLTPLGTHPDLLVDLGRSKVPCPCSSCRKTRASRRVAERQQRRRDFVEHWLGPLLFLVVVLVLLVMASL